MKNLGVALASLVIVPIVSIVACGGDEAGSSTSSSGATSSGGGSSSGASGNASSGGTASGGVPYNGETHQGIATYYDADGSGNCGFDKSDDLDVTALDMGDYAKSAACGSCIKVTGPKGTITVRVVDSCPGCEDSHLDLSESAFAKVAEVKDGRVPITWQVVACEVTGNLTFHFKDGSSKYWTAIQIRNHRLPITKLEYKKGGAFVEMPRADYNYFIDESGVGNLPSGLALRVTAADGQTIEDALPGDIPDNKDVAGNVQFK